MAENITGMHDNMDAKGSIEAVKKERAETFEMLSESTQKLLSDNKLKEYADMQAELYDYSASNVLLIMEQKPGATWVRPFEDWNADKVKIIKGEKGIRTLSSATYRKEDGTVGMRSVVEKVFDVSQTELKDIDPHRPKVTKAPEAIMIGVPHTAEAADIPDGADALYDPGENIIEVKEGLSPAEMLFAVARERAVEKLTIADGSSREEVLDKAELAAYILTKRCGFEPPAVDFDRISAKFRGREEKDVRSMLGNVRFIVDRMEKQVRESIKLCRTDKEREDR